MTIYKSSKGYMCAEKNGKNLHSQYNPIKEAQRFVSKSIDNEPSIIILLGAGLGYIVEEICHKYKDSLILAVLYSEDCYNNLYYKNDNVKYWHPLKDIDISTFFKRNITERQIGKLKTLQWNPSSLIYPQLTQVTNQSLKRIVQRYSSNIHTTAGFGKKWLSNMLCNYLSLNTYCSYPKEKTPIVICSSGPSLEKNIEDFKKYRNKFRLWALPSSLSFLNHHSIRADLLVSTDPGYYGSYHFKSIIGDLPVAAPLTTSRELWKYDSPLLLLNQQLPYEEDLFKYTNLNKVNILSNGTVSGTALNLALKFSDQVYFAGLDLCYRDIQSHVFPHSFDFLLEEKSSRLNPLQSIYFHRASDTEVDFHEQIRISRSLKTYLEWFNEISEPSTKSIKRLHPSSVSIINMKRGVLDELEDFPTLSPIQFTDSKAKPFSHRLSQILNLLSSWQKDISLGKRLDLQYFIDTISFCNGSQTSGTENYISRLRGIYGK